ncbi:VWA domain-containing protein [Lysinibacillus yapensis]|uniref:VWA domain-containing protein n=2 Tax=Ureibacillus yapensis TaxID=2304605 RepID=A0A396SFU0_9BACL|nr:VWA domain-containing protein [Lysinibacillus yapensis]
MLLVLLMVLLVGCSQEGASTEEGTAAQTDNSSEEHSDNSNEIVEEEVLVGPPIPTSLEELADLPKGYTEHISRLEEEGRKLTDELTKNLPDISGNPTNEELDRYYEAILSVFQQDYEGPGDLINQLKFQSIGDPDIEEPRYQFKENLNVVMILDASGSMANEEGNGTRMDAAKNAIHEFVKALPEEANVGLRIYGHEGTGEVGDQALSCKSSELIYPISPYEEAGFNEALKKATPAGWTPIGYALNEAQKDLSSFKGDKNTNIIYLVSDGISTCEDDPINSAKSLYDSDITPIVNVIGFNVDQEAQKQLQEIADVTEGRYENVTDSQGLEEELRKANDIAFKWKQWKTKEEGSINLQRTTNSLDIFGYHSGEFGKWVDERQAVGFTLTYLLQKREKMSKESHDYLQEKNKEYHSWIEQEYDELRDELKEINELNHTEAIKQMEEKYLSNTTKTP